LGFEAPNLRQTKEEEKRARRKGHHRIVKLFSRDKPQPFSMERLEKKWDVCSPYISPKYGDMRGLPPVYISAGWTTHLLVSFCQQQRLTNVFALKSGDGEALLGDIRAYYDRCREAGVDAELFLGKNMDHDYQFLFSIAFVPDPEIDRYWEELRTWLRRHSILGGASS